MDLQSQSSRSVEGIRGLIAGIIPKHSLLESNSCCIDCNIIEVQGFTTISEEIVRQLSVFSPIFDCSQVERVKVNGSNFLSLSNGLNIVFLKQIEYVFSYFTVVIELPIHLGIFCFDQNACESIVWIPTPLMLLVEGNDHLNHIAQEREGELVIKNSQSSRGLCLLYTQGFQLSQGELVSPPVSLVVSIIFSSLVSGREFSLVSDVGNASEERVMHDQKLHVFSVDYIQLNKISPLVECCREGLKGVLRKDRAESAMSDVEGPARAMNIASFIGFSQ